jgi:hypothetical protein
VATADELLSVPPEIPAETEQLYPPMGYTENSPFGLVDTAIDDDNDIIDGGGSGVQQCTDGSHDCDLDTTYCAADSQGFYCACIGDLIPATRISCEPAQAPVAELTVGDYYVGFGGEAIPAVGGDEPVPADFSVASPAADDYTDNQPGDYPAGDYPADDYSTDGFDVASEEGSYVSDVDTAVEDYAAVPLADLAIPLMEDSAAPFATQPLDDDGTGLSSTCAGFMWRPLPGQSGTCKFFGAPVVLIPNSWGESCTRLDQARPHTDSACGGPELDAAWHQGMNEDDCKLVCSLGPAEDVTEALKKHDEMYEADELPEEGDAGDEGDVGDEGDAAPSSNVETDTMTDPDTATTLGDGSYDPSSGSSSTEGAVYDDDLSKPQFGGFHFNLKDATDDDGDGSSGSFDDADDDGHWDDDAEVRTHDDDAEVRTHDDATALALLMPCWTHYILRTTYSVSRLPFVSAVGRGLRR